MFFIFGIDKKIKQLKFIGIRYFKQLNSLKNHYICYMYDCFSLFFIPIIKWNKKYVIICQNTIIKELDNDYAQTILTKYANYPNEQVDEEIYEEIINYLNNHDLDDLNIVDDLYNLVNSHFSISLYEIDYRNMIENIVNIEKNKLNSLIIKDSLL